MSMKRRWAKKKLLSWHKFQKKDGGLREAVEDLSKFNFVLQEFLNSFFFECEERFHFAFFEIVQDD